MRNVKRTIIRMGTAGLLATSLTLTLVGCGGSASKQTSTVENTTELAATEASTGSDANSVVATANLSTSGAIDTTDLFTERDLTQTADTAGATTIAVTSGQDVQITEEGVYVITGEASDVTITVEAADEAKVQLVLDGVSITNSDSPAIYVKNADKVFVTTTEGSTNTLQVTGTFVADGETNTDAVIFSRDDLVLNGLGTLTISSTANGITSKDDLKVTGGSYSIRSQADALEANDSIAICDGSFAISSQKDALHAENDEDDTVGYVYICGGSFEIEAAGDGIQATTIVQIDGGSLAISAAEALEATYVQVNDGTLDLSASDDGINATNKSQSLGTPTIELTGGNITITMAAGDTDALDANGDIVVSGGTIDISAQFAFDFDGSSSFTGGTIAVNGEQVDSITNSMMGGGMMGGMGPGGMGHEQGEMMGQGEAPMGGDFRS